MNKRDHRAGVTLVEVLISVVLVSVAAVLVYQGMFYSYKVLARARARLEAQGIAFDKLWILFNMDFKDLPGTAFSSGPDPTPENSIFSTNGVVRYSILPETHEPLHWIDYWEIRVQVWPPAAGPLFSVLDSDGSVLKEYPRPLADYRVYRYRGDR
ncbi:MAG: type pilus assembly protein PilE [Verrucomicrobiota bacterium]|jgi:prepilin-type N-terminal cleavage/methylation domain-containing protein|nr:type pilus assembly protein PilE [Verrucomicrobiota bacterium]MDK2962783.1 type pilus assembly protein PilE [Verrucomicrobiota bacterium]